MAVDKDVLKVHMRTDCSKAVSALHNCIMAGAFMPLYRAIWLEIRSESLKESAWSWTVARLSRPDPRISGDSVRIGQSGTPGGQFSPLGPEPTVDRRGSPAIREKRQETAGPDWPPWVLHNSPANRTDDLYSTLPSDWLQPESLA